jgi:flavodoxin
MKILIIYSSQTGNTKKLAEELNNLLGGEKTFCHISQAPEPAGYDLVALGFWLMAGKPDITSSEYLEKITGVRLFLFATHGAAAGSQHALNAMAHARSLAPSAQIVGTFDCAGEVDGAFLEKAQKKDPPPPWIADAPQAVGHPNATDIHRLADTVKVLLPEFLSQQ